MCPGTYHGGGTLVGFGHDAKRRPKDSPADSKDLAAGRKYASRSTQQTMGDELKIARARRLFRPGVQRKVAAAKARKAEENKKRRQLKEERRNAQEAAHVVNQARRKAKPRQKLSGGLTLPTLSNLSRR